MSQLPEAIATIKINAQTIFNTYQVALNHARPNVPTPSSSSSQSSKRTVGVRALSAWTWFRGSQGSSTSDFSQLNELEIYLSQGIEKVNPDGSFNILECGRTKKNTFRFFQGWPETF